MHWHEYRVRATSIYIMGVTMRLATPHDISTLLIILFANITLSLRNYRILGVKSTFTTMLIMFIFVRNSGYVHSSGFRTKLLLVHTTQHSNNLVTSCQHHTIRRSEEIEAKSNTVIYELQQQFLYSCLISMIIIYLRCNYGEKEKEVYEKV